MQAVAWSAGVLRCLATVACMRPMDCLGRGTAQKKVGIGRQQQQVFAAAAQNRAQPGLAYAAIGSGSPVCRLGDVLRAPGGACGNIRRSRAL